LLILLVLPVLVLPLLLVVQLLQRLLLLLLLRSHNTRGPAGGLPGPGVVSPSLSRCR
jgi:hypothetical protein